MHQRLQTPLTDTDHDWNDRLMRLQGWRGLDAQRAATSGGGDRVAPAFCAVGSLAASVLASPVIAAILALTALVGAFAPNHPVETLVNGLAARRGVAPMPANRAAKRLGCAMGVVFLGGATVALWAGNIVLGSALAGTLGVLAGFVALTGICVPSLVFTVLWGAERAQAPSLAAATQSSVPTPAPARIAA